jgi:hypothetical protein
MKNREQQLALVFGGMVLVFLLSFTFRTYQKQTRGLHQEREVLDLQKLETDSWLAQREELEQRDAWLQAKRPRIRSARAATADLGEQLESLAKASKLTVSSSKLMDPVVEDGEVELSATMTLEGNMEGLVRWCSQVQDPIQFRLFKGFTLNSKEDKATLVLSCQVIQWCKLVAGAEEEAVPAPAKQEATGNATAPETTTPQT